MVEIVIISYNIAGLLVGAYRGRNWKTFLKDWFVEHLKYQCYAVDDGFKIMGIGLAGAVVLTVIFGVSMIM